VGLWGKRGQMGEEVELFFINVGASFYEFGFVSSSVLFVVRGDTQLSFCFCGVIFCFGIVLFHNSFFFFRLGVVKMIGCY
jgi:hypothetical protein